MVLPGFGGAGNSAVDNAALVDVDLGAVAVDAADAAGEQVHPRAADEAGDEDVGGLVVEVERRADLLDHALAQHDDAVGEGHRLDLIVGDEDHRRAEAAVQAVDLDAHLHAEFGVEVGERLVEEEDLRLADDGPADRDALALAAGELAGAAVEKLRDLKDLGGVLHLALDLVPGRADGLEAEGEVLAHGHVRDRAHRTGRPWRGRGAAAGTSCIGALSMRSVAVGDRLEAGDHAQQRGLAAAGGADEDDELAVLDAEVDAVDDLDGAEALDDAAELEVSHGRLRGRDPAGVVGVVRRKGQRHRARRWRRTNRRR